MERSKMGGVVARNLPTTHPTGGQRVSPSGEERRFLGEESFNLRISAPGDSEGLDVAVLGARRDLEGCGPVAGTPSLKMRSISETGMRWCPLTSTVLTRPEAMNCARVVARSTPRRRAASFFDNSLELALRC